MRRSVLAMAVALTACSSSAFEVAPQADAVPDGVAEAAADSGSDTVVADTSPEVITSDAEGTPTGAFSLDGTGFGLLSSSELTHAPAGFTWTLWFRADDVPLGADLGRAQTLIAIGDDAPCEDIYLGFGSTFTAAKALTFNVDGLGGCGARNSTPVFVAPGSGFANGKWYHVAAVRDYPANKVAIFVNGALGKAEFYDRAPIVRATMKANIGRFSDGVTPSAYFKGAIDELSFYNYPMSATEIAGQYNAGKGRPGALGDVGLVTGFHLDEASGVVAKDYSASGRTITFSGGVKQVMGIVPKP